MTMRKVGPRLFAVGLAYNATGLGYTATGWVPAYHLSLLLAVVACYYLVRVVDVVIDPPRSMADP